MIYICIFFCHQIGNFVHFLLPLVLGGTRQTLALLLRLLAWSGMAKLELPRLLLTSGMSRLLLSRLLSQTTSCNLCHFWIWVFWFFITSSQWSLPVPRANMKPPRTVNPRGLSGKIRRSIFEGFTNRKSTGSQPKWKRRQPEVSWKSAGSQPEVK